MLESLDTRAKAVFDEAVERPGGERSAYLDRACAATPELRARVEALLSAAEKDDAFLATPTLSVDATTAARRPGEPSGTHIGPYELLELIGEGGFGSVYHARQTSPVQRDVALKIIKAGMDTGQVIARFEAERQALALMDHPNIARVLEAGTTETGRPYFVMELVSGEPVTRFCDGQRFTVRQRLDLFKTICSAVQHAHQKGIIHRDLKPSNILVSDGEHRRPAGVRGPGTGETPMLPGSVATPKIIDFGIAKAIFGHLTDRSLTAAPQPIGTPNYMSPEQMTPDQHDIDTRSDIYSLGVVLYELLTGSLPFERRRSTTPGSDAFQPFSRDQQPQRPSARLSASGNGGRWVRGNGTDSSQPNALATPNGPTLTSRLPSPPPSHTARESSLDEIAQSRHTEPAVLVRTLRRDLDWIVLKCLEGDRSRRYSSAVALADDIDRYLTDQPVVATPPSASYRIRKFVRRNRVAVIAGAAISLALVLGAIGTIVGLYRAVESHREALARADETRAVNEFMRDILTQVSPDAQGADVRLAQVLEKASARVPTHFADHPLQAARAHELLAEVYDKLTLFPNAQREVLAALRLYQRHAPPDDRATLLCERRCIAAALNLSQVKEVERRLADALPRFVRVFGPDNEHTQDLRRCEGWMHLRSGRPDEAEQIFLQLQAHPTQRDDERQFRILRHLITVQKYRATAEVKNNQAYWASVESLAREAFERAARHYGPDAAQTLGAHVEVAEALEHLGCYEEAEQLCRSVLARDWSRFGECHHIRREAWGTLAESIARQGHDREAAELTLQKLTCVRNTTNPGNVTLIGALFQSLPFWERAGLAVEGEAAARELIALVQPLGVDRSGHLLSAATCLGRFLSMQNRFDEAEQVFAAEFERAKGAPPNGRIARLHLDYGLHLAARGAYADAEAQLQKAVSQAGDVRAGTWYSHPDDLIVGFIELYRQWGNAEKVREYERLRADTFGLSP